MKKDNLIFLKSESETKSLAALIAKELRQCFLDQSSQTPLVIGLSGPLGSGKTTLVREILLYFGIKDPIKSPSFSLIEIYNNQETPIYHLDTYRLKNQNDFFESGLEECFTETALIFVEWPEKVGSYIESFYDIHILFEEENSNRYLKITPYSIRGQLIRSQVFSKLN